MKIQLNLYHPSCYPKREKATFRQLLSLLTLCISASLLCYFVVNKQAQTLNELILIQKIQLTDKQLQLSDLVVELQKNRAPDNKLRQHATLQSEIKAKQRLLSSLAGIDLQEQLSFSALMRGLSYADMPDVTLHRFSMVEGILNIEGDAKQSDSVPLWLSNMQVTAALPSVAFNALSISEQRGFFTFQLTNSKLKGKNSE
ncbi:hypothetical protein [Psychromonas hadalis]|uniref:hypothetical protein n=1 Tax=Psychromonas hadalis TaxID=211669 RepID=UPI0003B6E488|nr:hypothetical protein [Psychromonas hadalis]